MEILLHSKNMTIYRNSLQFLILLNILTYENKLRNIETSVKFRLQILYKNACHIPSCKYLDLFIELQCCLFNLLHSVQLHIFMQRLKKEAFYWVNLVHCCKKGSLFTCRGIKLSTCTISILCKGIKGTFFSRLWPMQPTRRPDLISL